MTTSTRIVTLLVFSACASSAATKNGPTHTIADFECKDRSAEYTIAGGLMSHHESGLVEPEVGVVVTCTGDRLRLEKWRLLGADGNRKSSSHSLTPDEFEEFWVNLESLGWRNIRDCDNPEAAEDDPVHTFAIADESSDQSLSCPGKVLPFPFDRLRNTFDLTAGAYD
jgi:hypothetical protein